MRAALLDAGLTVDDLGAPIDVLWMRLPWKANDPDYPMGRFDRGRIFVMIYRGDYWQCAFVIPKGGYEAVKARGLPALLDDIVRMAPVLKTGIADVRSWDDMKLLTVAINRLHKWALPGLLAARLQQGAPAEAELDAVQARREFPVRMTQRMQVVGQDTIVAMALKQGGRPLKAPLPLRIVTAVPWLQGITARFLGLGVRPEHVHSPVAGG